VQALRVRVRPREILRRETTLQRHLRRCRLNRTRRVRSSSCLWGFFPWKPVRLSQEKAEIAKAVSRPFKVQIIERGRALIADEEHWCRRHFAEDANGFPVSATSASAIKWCGLGAVIAAAYQLTHNTDAAYQVGYQILRPRYGSATLIHTNDERGHAAVLALFDEIIAADG
jgi:hypothetical protein